MKQGNPTIYKLFATLVLAVFGVSFLISPNTSYGAEISQSSDHISQLKAGASADHTIKFTTPSGAGQGGASPDTITITFPSGFNLSPILASDCSLSHGITGEEVEETLSDEPTTNGWGIGISNQTITITHPIVDSNGDISPDEVLLFKVGKNVVGGVNQIQNGTSGNYTLSIAGTFGDTGQIPIIILDNDQIYTELNVVPRISLTLSSNTSSFGQIYESMLGTVVTSTPDIVLTVSTNHSNGYSVYINDQGNGLNPGIYNSSLNILLGSATSNFDNNINLDSTIAGYGIQAECISGCNTNNEITERFRVSGNTIAGLERTPGVKLLEYGTYLSEEHIVKIQHKIKISEYTRTGDYTDNITYTATSRY